MAEQPRAPPIDRPTDRRAGLIKRQFHGGHGKLLADAIIASTAHESQSDPAALDVKRFPSFPSRAPVCREPPA